MKREEAKAVLYEWQKSMVEHGVPIDTSKVQALRVAIEALSAERWIPCPERLPKKGEVVLITNGKGNVRCGQYRSEHDVRGETHYWWWKGKTVESVIAWMPLPTPYKGGDTDDV